MMNEELYDILRASADRTGLPVMKSTQFISTTEKYGKDVFLSIKHIGTNRLPKPSQLSWLPSHRFWTILLSSSTSHYRGGRAENVMPTTM